MTTDVNKMREKIAALLRKAESTNFGPEAEELVAKAHELMARYAIEEAELHAATGTHEAVVQVYLPNKTDGWFPVQRAQLINTIAQNNRCRVVMEQDRVSINGFKTDAEQVKELYESLSLQMMQGVLAAEREWKSNGMARTKKSLDTKTVNFMYGYIERIGERLKENRKKVETEMAPTGSSTALVLRDRKQEVDKWMEDKYPNLSKVRSRRYMVDGEAQGQGRSHANRSDIGQGKVGGTRKELT